MPGAMAEKRRIGFIVTRAEDDPERATLPFMIATMALAMDVEPLIILQGEGVRLGVKGFAERIAAKGLQPLEPMLAGVLEAGCSVMVCSPCMLERGIAEEDLREGVFVGGAAKVVEAMLECVNMASY